MLQVKLIALGSQLQAEGIKAIAHLGYERYGNYIASIEVLQASCQTPECYTCWTPTLYMPHPNPAQARPQLCITPAGPHSDTCYLVQMLMVHTYEIYSACAWYLRN